MCDEWSAVKCGAVDEIVVEWSSGVCEEGATFACSIDGCEAKTAWSIGACVTGVNVGKSAEACCVAVSAACSMGACDAAI